MDTNALNILLVDDDRLLSTTLSHGLRKGLGKRISIAACSNSSEALTLLATQTFDLVISDHHMPGMTGFELLNQIKQDHRETRLVLVTAFGTDDLEQEAGRLGIGYLTKPFEMPHLVQLIRDLRADKGMRGGPENPQGLREFHTRPGNPRAG